MNNNGLVYCGLVRRVSHAGASGVSVSSKTKFANDVIYVTDKRTPGERAH